MKHEIVIRKAKTSDFEAIWKIVKTVIATEDTYVFAADSKKEDLLGYWCGKDKHTYVATINEAVVGTFIIKDNFQDLGSHTANASYMTMPSEGGKGIGKTMGAFSFEEARRLGYKAMQFNIVVKSNERAVRLWKKLGFRIIGEIPEAFNHKQLGLTNAYIMWRKL